MFISYSIIWVPGVCPSFPCNPSYLNESNSFLASSLAGKRFIAEATALIQLCTSAAARALWTQPLLWAECRESGWGFCALELCSEPGVVGNKKPNVLQVVAYWLMACCPLSHLCWSRSDSLSLRKCTFTCRREPELSDNLFSTPRCSPWHKTFGCPAASLNKRILLTWLYVAWKLLSLHWQWDEVVGLMATPCVFVFTCKKQ